MWILGTFEDAGIHAGFLCYFCNCVLINVFLRLKLIPAVAATAKCSGHGCFNREREPFSSTNSVQFPREDDHFVY